MSRIELCDRMHCTGCAACSSICPKKAITMQVDEEGFLMPHINRDLCVECGLCQKTCPVLSYKDDKKAYPLTIYAGYINKMKSRRHSSSGGAFVAFAEHYYSLGNGVVVAAAFDEHLSLKHIVSTNHKDLHKFQGSKYLQSNTCDIYPEVLNNLLNGKEVLFIGTPCQVAGLKSFLREDYANLLTVDLVCHGVPSPQLFKFYLKQVGINFEREFEDFYFRNQKLSVYFQHSVVTKSGSEIHISPSKHSYICAYLKGWLHRESCYNCPFASIPRQADCSIADFWGVLSHKVPFAGDASNGVSMIMINTEKGEKIFNEIKKSFYVENKTLDDAKIDNHNLYTHDIRPEIRDVIYSEFQTLTPEEFMMKYNLALPLPRSIWERIKGRIKRTFTNK